jgi:hypothetical protein
VRIVVSGTHASGKSTLISDFRARHPGFVVLPDPFEMLDEFWDSPDPTMFAAQLRLAADRLTEDGDRTPLIAERGPVDFLAYILALSELTGQAPPASFVDRATRMTAVALGAVDLLVVLPLTAADPIPVSTDEDLALRAAMNDVLLELVDDRDVIGDRVAVAEITGDPERRLAALERMVD